MDQKSDIWLTFGLIGIIIIIVLTVYFTRSKTSSGGGSTTIEIEWVAVGQVEDSGSSNTNIQHSENGKNWFTSNSNGASFDFAGNGVAYGTSDGTKELWVAIGSDSADNFDNILYSSDGKTWHQSDNTGTSFTVVGRDVTYGTSDGTCQLWVAVGENSHPLGNIMWSEDGKIWNNSLEGASFSLVGYGVAYGTSDGEPENQLWVATGGDTSSSDPGEILWSKDGKTWNLSDDDFAVAGLDVAYGTSNGTSQLWVAVGLGDTSDLYTNIIYSENGKDWFTSEVGASFSEYGSGVAYGTSDGTCPLWVAVGQNNSDSNYGHILYSEDGKTWHQSDPNDYFHGYGQNVAYRKVDTGALWVAVGTANNVFGPGQILWSNNGKTWNLSVDDFGITGNDVAASHLLYGMSPDYYHP